jgi:hypothetical protein
MMWEVFNPKDGHPVVITRFKWAAKFVAWVKGLDYDEQGKGWNDAV